MHAEAIDLHMELLQPLDASLVDFHYVERKTDTVIICMYDESRSAGSEIVVRIMN